MMLISNHKKKKRKKDFKVKFKLGNKTQDVFTTTRIKCVKFNMEKTWLSFKF